MTWLKGIGGSIGAGGFHAGESLREARPLALALPPS